MMCTYKLTAPLELIGLLLVEDYMLCKQENRDPGHCLKEGRRVTRCATDLYGSYIAHIFSLGLSCTFRITKMRENCLQQFDAHWNCLELHNQVCIHTSIPPS